MAIDKALYAAPQGIDQIADQEEPIEIQIEDPESVSIKQGNMELDIEPAEEEDDGFDFEATLRDIHVELQDLNAQADELAAKIVQNFEDLGI